MERKLLLANKKTIKCGELSYIFGILLLALGTALMARADFGVSVVVAPAYIFSIKFQGITFGMAEYILQACLLLLMCIIIRRFRGAYLFSFVSAFLYGCVLDVWMELVAWISMDQMFIRLTVYILGFFVSAFSVSLLVHTYLAPEVYELLVKEVSSVFRIDFGKLKIGYDVFSCAISIVLSLVFFSGLHALVFASILFSFVI